MVKHVSYHKSAYGVSEGPKFIMMKIKLEDPSVLWSIDPFYAL